jgi:hypothetical protein
MNKDKRITTKLKFITTSMAFVVAAGSCKSTTPVTSKLTDNNKSPEINITPQFFPITGPTEAIPRNRKITRNYFYGAQALNKILHNENKNSKFDANWLHFGIWGSMRAGESIDGSDLQLAATIKDMAFDALEQSLSWLPTSLRHYYVSQLQKDRELIKNLGKIMKEALAGGNQRVANEIMGLTDRYLRVLGCVKSYDEDTLKKFLGSFEYRHDPNAPFNEIWDALLDDIPLLSKGRPHTFGQDALARAYKAYHQSRFEKDPLIRSQMIHYANLLIAIHEQFALQTYISGAIGILDPASSVYRKAATVFALDIGIPEPGFKGVTRMGEGLARYPLRKGFPSKNFSRNLRKYVWPPLVDLAKVTGIDKYAGRGASDWQDYKTRVHLISGMIRTLQENPTIASFPFSGPYDQVAVSCQ